MIDAPTPTDLTANELAELVVSGTQRRLLSGLDELMMMDPIKPYEPRVAHLVMDMAVLDSEVMNHATSAKQVQVVTERLRDEHLPAFDRHGIIEYERDEDRIRTTKSTMLFAAAIDEIDGPLETDSRSETICIKDAKVVAEMWLLTATREFDRR